MHPDPGCICQDHILGLFVGRVEGWKRFETSNLGQLLGRDVEEAGLGVEEELMVLDSNHCFSANWKVL